jgi:hypothetical protein
LADAIFESSIDSCSELLRHAEPEDLDQSQRSKIEEAVECLVRAAEIQGAFVPREEFGLPAYLNLVDHRIPHLQILLGRESEARAWWRNTCDSARGKEIVYRVGMSKFGEFDASSLVQLHVDAGVFWRSIDLLEAEYHVRKASEEVDRLERAGKDSTGDRECVAVVARYIHSISK